MKRRALQWSFLILITLSFSNGYSIDRKLAGEQDREASDRAAQIVTEVIDSGMTEFEKALILHEYITGRVTYGKLDGVTSAYTALCHDRADCVGFARGLQRLYEKAGLDSFVVVRKKGHLWVKVKIRGSYYNIDPTWSAVKSRWPRYNWFLLSDAQNVDTEKGVDHVLDSGEAYEPAPGEFVFQEQDFIHRKKLRSPENLRIMGTVSLPGEMKAPAGGIMGSVGGTRFFIPEGRSSVFFIAGIDRNTTKAPVLIVKVNNAPSESALLPQVYYSFGGSSEAGSDAFHFDTSADDYTGINVVLMSRKNEVTGEVRPSRPVFVYRDLIAADDEAARYRTGTIDPNVEKVPANIENALFTAPGEKTLSVFTAALMKGTRDPFVKAKRIHDWITLRIAYDSDLLIRMKKQKDPQGSIEPFGVLQYRRSNCDGLARLYEKMAASAGLKARYVTGMLKRSETASGGMMNHAWNLVKLKGKWYIVDCSADTRVFWTSGRYSKMMDYEQKSDHLFISPEAKSLAYLANEPADQLLGSPVSREDFLKRPRVEVAMAKFGITLVDDTSSGVETYREEKKSGGAELHDMYTAGKSGLEIRLKNPESVFVQAELLDPAGKKIEGLACTERKAGATTCYFFLPSKGDFQGRILARSLGKPDRVNIIYQFRIRASVSSSFSLPRVRETYYAVLQGVRLGKLYRNTSSGQRVIEIIHPEDVKVVSFVRDETGKTVSGAVKYWKYDAGTKCEYTLPDKKGLIIFISGSPVPDTGGKGHQRMFEIDPSF